MVSATPAMEVELAGAARQRAATGRNGSDGVVGVVGVLWDELTPVIGSVVAAKSTEVELFAAAKEMLDLGLGGADDTWADRRRQGLGFATGRNGSDGVVGVVVVVGGGEEMGTADLKKIG
ncbi:hypothetical protein M0R45_008850 [Rubus argutus]|uniref:Uncharacterized protein n=1 Tax=Rubus argutus TaxID=59490 RepID=A0AAW1Y2H4_RUBAR